MADIRLKLGDLIITWGHRYLLNKTLSVILSYRFVLKLTPKRVKWLIIFPDTEKIQIRLAELNKLHSYTYGDTEILHSPKSIRKIIKEIFKIKRG